MSHYPTAGSSSMSAEADRRQAGGHPADATRSRPGQQLPQYPRQRHRGRVRRMERPGRSVPDAAETAPVRDPLLHPRSRRSPDRSGANHRPRRRLDASSLAIANGRLARRPSECRDHQCKPSHRWWPSPAYEIPTSHFRQGRYREGHPMRSDIRPGAVYPDYSLPTTPARPARGGFGHDHRDHRHWRARILLPLSSHLLSPPVIARQLASGGETTPPRPSTRASDAAQNRRARSFSSGASARNRSPINRSSITPPEFYATGPRSFEI